MSTRTIINSFKTGKDIKKFREKHLMTKRALATEMLCPEKEIINAEKNPNRALTKKMKRYITLWVERTIVIVYSRPRKKESLLTKIKRWIRIY